LTVATTNAGPGGAPWDGQAIGAERSKLNSRSFCMGTLHGARQVVIVSREGWK
jgi:hypothetical protein